MFKSLKKASEKAGLPPGTLVHVGGKKTDEILLRVFDFNETTLEERELDPDEDFAPYSRKHTNTWINVDGLHRVDVIEKIGMAFDLHPLVLEDILHTEQRAKVEDQDDYIFFILKMISYDEETEQVESEQFSLLLGRGFVLSFQERPGDVFETVRERLRKNKGRLRRYGSDYLAYALLDAVIDSYFSVLERLGERIEALEEKIMENPDSDTLNSIHSLNRELIFLRKAIWPVRELVGNLEKWESPLINEKTVPFLKDLEDHVLRVIETIGTFRELAIGMREVYLSSMSNRMNEVMKLLTIVATLFIPLTFVAGIYGMNFKVMPELEWPWGYPLALGLMLVVALVMLFWFRRRRLL